MSQVPAKQQSQQTTIAELLEANRDALLQALPRTVKIDRFLRVAMNAIAKNPELQKCSGTSLYSAIMQSAQFGLEIGLMNQAHLVPYWNSGKGCFEAQFQIGYLGLRDMAEWYGDVIDGDAQAVHEKDTFDYALGDSPFVTHKPSLDQDRGPMVAFYCWAQPKQGKIKISVMSKHEVEEHRDRFAKRDKTGKLLIGPAWDKTFESMGLKTVIRRCYKLLARSPQLREAIALDELAEVQIPQGLSVVAEQEQREVSRQSNEDKLKALQQKEPEREGAAPATPSGVSEPGASSSASGAPSTADETENPTVKYRRALATTEPTNQAVNAWWGTVPEELKQDLYQDYSEALKDVAKQGKKK